MAVDLVASARARRRIRLRVDNTAQTHTPDTAVTVEVVQAPSSDEPNPSPHQAELDGVFFPLPPLTKYSISRMLTPLFFLLSPRNAPGETIMLKPVDPRAALKLITESGALASGVDAWINSLRTKEPSFYTRTLKTRGHAVAEQELEKARASQEAFASQLQPVAEAMLAMTMTDSRSVKAHATRFSKADGLPMTSWYSQGILVFLTNPELPGCGCSQPSGAEVFGRYGTLGVRALAVAYGEHNYRSKSVSASIGLVLASNPVESVSDIGFRIAEVDNEGFMHGSAYSEKPNLDAFILKQFGGEAKSFISVMHGGSADHAIGFPDGAVYLAKHWPNLASYLRAAAELLKDGHKH